MPARSPARGEDRSAAGSPIALGSDAVSIEIASLNDLDLDALRVRWRKLFRATAPPHLPRYLLLRMVAYRIQANAYGDLDRDTVRFLDRIARAREARRVAGGKPSSKAVPPVPPALERGSLKPGTLLVREHAGTMHRATVVAEGFSWNGSTYRSLSEVARAITGTNWNGPRFFGLREREKPARSAPGSEEARP